MIKNKEQEDREHEHELQVGIGYIIMVISMILMCLSLLILCDYSQTYTTLENGIPMKIVFCLAAFGICAIFYQFLRWAGLV